ncbi:hypothetical protein [Streptomyces sp. KL116D]|uniref:hypothetical protein n=1 Tax=Streptomyces sp. KL116D TaxID=3045152 RepID=UPI0035592D86
MPPAPVCDGRTLTYQELDDRANDVAWQLVRHGAGPDDLPLSPCRAPRTWSSASWASSSPAPATCRFDLQYLGGRAERVLSEARPRFAVTDTATSRDLPPHDMTTIDPTGAPSGTCPEGAAQRRQTCPSTRTTPRT